jgi:hypothetical protein
MFARQYKIIFSNSFEPSMTKKSYLAFTLAASMFACQQPSNDNTSENENSSTEAVSTTAEEAEFQPIFNGENLDGWEIHGTEKWYVEDGQIICESGPDAAYGYLATDKSYKDFILELEFKQEADGNSGVFFRSSLDGTKISGWQVEVAPPGNDTGGIYESYGRGWLEQIPEEKEDILKMGEWNKMRIEVIGGKVSTYLNGEEMVVLEDEKIGEANGSIALQIHDGGGIKVRWRDLQVKEM